MNILILTIGTRGDIQPFVALGKGLKAAGHAVTVCTASTFEPMIAEHGLGYAYMNDGIVQLMDTSAGKDAVESGRGFGLIKTVKPILRQMMDEAWQAAQGAEAIVYHPKTLAGYHIAEKANLPVIMSLPLPAYTPTSEFTNPLFGRNLKLGGGFNRLTYAATTRMASAPYIDVINAWRQSVSLPRRSRFASEMVLPDGQPMPTLYSYSPHVVPAPKDWPPTTTATGYWFLDQPTGWQPSPELSAFLDAGDPPVYVGFGSIAGHDPEAKARLVLTALEQAGQRGILASGWGGLKANALPESVLAVEQVPHDWLFPRVKAVVHHGGAGTTAAGLRAGKPTVICPFFGDQPFWGQRVYDLGVGAAPIPQKTLTAEALTAAVRSVATDTAMQQRAAALGEQIRAEDGVGRAVDIINGYLRR